ncbi:tape measure protein [Enterobacter roggenkampii]|uniref:tape measure protein n=1 Tax=Enterobacter roggenkampii TaxID=1812935 RepID=UPI001658D9EA|nr:tape measure protein [Enterobacter roggenkampii]MCM7332698.1 tape measure protein [Enterobacter roggenkampii]QNQ31387.1 tape measure protein [Enterobacter roggenkampii]
MASNEQVGNIVYQVQMDVAELIEAQRKVNDRLDKMGSNFDRASGSVSRFEGALNKVGVAIASAFTIDAAKRLIAIGDEMVTLEARIARLSPSIDAARETMKALSSIASQTGNSLSETERLWESLTTSLKETGATNSQILKLTSTLQQIGTIGGASTEEMANALRQFGQSISGGIVRAEEFNSILEQMPELARQIAAGLGISTDQLRQRMLEGKLTAQDALNAIQKQSQSVNEEFEKMPVNVDRAKNSLDVAFRNAINDLNQAIGLTSTLAGLMQSVADNLNYYNNNVGDSSRMPKLIKLQQELNEEIKDGQRWYESDTIFQQRRAQAAFQLKQVEGEIAHIRAKASKDADNNQFNSPGTKGDDAATKKLVQNSERRLALAKLEGEARARLQAQYDAADAGVTDQKRIKALQDEYAETYRVTEARKESNKEGKTSASQAESIAQKLASLKQQSELAAESTSELSREQAILTAQQSLGAAATQKDLELAGQYAAAKWDTANALKAQASAEKLLPEARENASYKQDVEDLKTALAAKKINQDQYNKTAERLEENHQVNLAKIRAQQVVTPQQSALGEIDPVQQLENQHAQQLALIQQFETQKGQITQRGLELMNAANTQYEQARIAAQWEIYRNQSTTNQLMADAVDSLQSGATNAITGLINGTQSLQESFANIGTTILNSVVGSLVQMGIEWAKSQLMGQAAATASLASTMAQATVAASAWAPAAMSASIATMGSAAAVGQTAYAGSLLAAKGMAVAGAREHGGPVNANSMYRVGEGGKPEIYQANNGSQYMIPGDNGRVISNRDMGGGGSDGGSFVQHITFEINTTGGIDDATMAKMSQMMKQVSLNTIRDQQRPNGLLRR